MNDMIDGKGKTPTEEEKTEGKNFAIISYLTLIGLIIALILNNEKQYEFTRYHIRQMLGLSLTFFALGFVNVIPILGQLAFFAGVICVLYMWGCGLLNAVNGRMAPMPLVGDKYQEIFKNL